MAKALEGLGTVALCGAGLCPECAFMSKNKLSGFPSILLEKTRTLDNFIRVSNLFRENP